MVAVQVNAQNGWNNDPDNNSDKTFGGQIAITPVAGSSVVFNTYIGKETTDETRMLFDLILAYTVSDMVGLSLNGDFFKEGDINWWAAGLKARFILSDMFNLALRGEFLQSKDGGYNGVNPAGGTTGIYEGTVTAVVPIQKNYEFRLELRGDFSDKEIFVKGAEPKKNQFTGLIAFLAWLP
jgi:hypothetical protein